MSNVKEAPERIGRYAYSETNVQYAEAPAFISGQTEYVRADLYEAQAAELAAVKAERDYAVSEMKEARTYRNIETGHAEDAEARAERAEAALAELEADVERLRQAASDADIVANHFKSERDHLQECLEDVLEQMALSRTGAVKGLQWIEAIALGNTRKLVALDCFHNEFARLDLPKPDDFVATFKAQQQRRYEACILSVLEPAAPEGEQEHEHIEVTDAGLIQFAEWFRKNYPGPDTVIHKPDWHAPKIYRAARHAFRQQEPEDRQEAVAEPYGYVADNAKWRGFIFSDRMEAEDRVQIFGGSVVPVYTHPAEQAVTDARSLLK